MPFSVFAPLFQLFEPPFMLDGNWLFQLPGLVELPVCSTTPVNSSGRNSITMRDPSGEHGANYKRFRHDANICEAGLLKRRADAIPRVAGDIPAFVPAVGRGQAGFFDVDERLKELSAKGDALERLSAVVDFELFRADLERAVPRSDGAKGGRPAFDHVLMFKMLVLQASHNLSDERTEYLIRDRLSFMRFLGLGLADTVPDANTIWTFREALTRARIAGKPAIEVLFERFDAALAAAGFLAMSGQIIDASIVAAPKQRNTDGEKRDIKEGRIPPAVGEKAGQAAPEGPRRTLDGQIHQGQAERGRCAARRSRGPGLRLQEPRRHRSPASPDPPLGRHRRGASRRCAAARFDRQEQHRQRRLGRHRLSLQGQ